MVGIAPICVAAGLQNKFLEGMAMGLPMVVTSAANEGIHAKSSEELFVVDRPEDMAQTISELFANHIVRQRIAAAGRRFIEEKLTWEYHFELLEQHLCKLAQDSE